MAKRAQRDWKNDAIDVLRSHGVSDKAMAALLNAGYLTLGALEDRQIGPNGMRGRLTLIPGIGPKEERMIEDAMNTIGVDA